MKIKLFILSITTLLLGASHAQQFIDKGTIEFEVKTNIKKSMGNSSWVAMLKESLPEFKTSYYSYSFANNQSIYTFDRWADGPRLPEFLRRGDESNVWYYNFTDQKMSKQKSVFSSNFVIEDSISNIEWKLTNESRLIAGFNCRKAVGKIMDSVYVFAFYTDEITISGGPCSINGLPGMILGLTIPRLYSSWIATKVIVTKTDEKSITPISGKKKYSYKLFSNTLDERLKEWGGNEDEEDRKWREQLYWNALL
ncbi:GLPGLI family protein [Ferruginibacter sp. SUN002]|uniref:GLPGLI family protein n=1 Tax=Ferruginibacter sp. SUN002 TaxID=2937789 RepID=UPI003D36B7A4